MQRPQHLCVSVWDFDWSRVTAQTGSGEAEKPWPSLPAMTLFWENKTASFTFLNWNIWTALLQLKNTYMQNSLCFNNSVFAALHDCFIGMISNIRDGFTLGGLKWHKVITVFFESLNLLELNFVSLQVENEESGRIFRCLCSRFSYEWSLYLFVWLKKYRKFCISPDFLQAEHQKCCSSVVIRQVFWV